MGRVSGAVAVTPIGSGNARNGEGGAHGGGATAGAGAGVAAEGRAGSGSTEEEEEEVEAEVRTGIWRGAEDGQGAKYFYLQNCNDEETVVVELTWPGGPYVFWGRSAALTPTGRAGGRHVDHMAGFPLAIKQHRMDVSPAHPRSTRNLLSLLLWSTSCCLSGWLLQYYIFWIY